MKVIRKCNKKKRIVIISIISLLGIFLTFFILVNISSRSMERYTEVSFVTPTEAIVFWKSKKNTLGYIKFSEKKFGKKTTALQTSSEPGYIHVVFLENIPTQGVYIRKYNEGDMFFILPRVQHIKYNSNTDERL